jgi:hypothetical protein
MKDENFLTPHSALYKYLLTLKLFKINVAGSDWFFMFIKNRRTVAIKKEGGTVVKTVVARALRLT